MKAFLYSAMLSFFHVIGGLLSRFGNWMVNTVLPEVGKGLMSLFTKLIEVMSFQKGRDSALFTNGMVLILLGVTFNSHMLAAIGFVLWILVVVIRFDKMGG